MTDLYSTQDLVNHFHESNLNGFIKLFFKKSEVKPYKSKEGKPFYVVHPLVVKVGDEFPDTNFSIFLKPKFYHQMNLLDQEFWVILIDDKQKTFKNPEGEDVSFYETKLNFITSSGLIDKILKKYMNISNVVSYDFDDL